MTVWSLFKTREILREMRLAREAMFGGREVVMWRIGVGRSCVVRLAWELRVVGELLLDKR